MNYSGIIRKIGILLLAVSFVFGYIAPVSHGVSFFGLGKDTNKEKVSKEQKAESEDIFKEGYSFYKQRDYKKAKELFEKALSVNPKYKKAESYIKKSNAKLEGERKVSIKKRIKEQKVESEDIFKEGYSFYKQRDYKKAKELFEKALSVNPKYKKAESYIKKADARLERDRKIKIKKRIRERKMVEKKAWGIFGLKKEGVDGILDDLPVKGVPQINLSLQECLGIALNSSIELEIAEKQVSLAEIRLFEAKRKMGPTLQGKWSEYGGKIYGRKYEGRKVLIEGSQPIFYGGEITYGVSQGRVNLEIVKNDRDRMKNEIILKVSKAYYSLDKAIKYRAFETELSGQAKILHDYIVQGYEQGAISKLEYLNVMAKYTQINFQKISADEDMLLAKLILQQAMNTDDNVEIMLTEEPEVNTDISLDNCYTLAYANRPEMKINYLMIEYYLYERKIAGSRKWPRIDAMGSFGYAYEDFVTIESDRERHQPGPEWYAGVKVNMPFWGNTAGYSFSQEHWQPVVSTVHGTDSTTHTATFDLLDDIKLYSELQESEIGYDRAKQEYMRSKNEVALEVKESYFAYRKALLQIGVADKKVAYQSTFVNILEERRKFGEVEISTVLEEMIKLGEEKFSAFQATSDYYIAIKTLNKSVGINSYFDRNSE